MVKKISYVLLAILMLAVNFYVPTYDAQAQTLGDLRRELEDFERRHRESQQQQQLTQQERNAAQARMATINHSITQIGEEMISLNNQIEELNEGIEQMELEIRDILAFTQVSGGESILLQYAFGAADFTDFIYRIAVAEQLTTHNDNLVREYQRKIEESIKKQEELRERRVRLDREQANLQVELNRIRGVLNQINENVLSIEDEIRVRRSRIRAFEQRGCTDNQSILTCGRAVLPPDTSFWRPLAAGWWSSDFGMRRHPIGGDWRMHNGLDVSNTNANNIDYPVFSVANGMVVGIIRHNPNIRQCGGTRVWIEHLVNGQLYTSAYWHLRSTPLTVGQIVTKNTVVGIMGGNPHTEPWDTCSTGAHLHLELSRGNFGGNYHSRLFNPRTVINFPGRLVRFNDRTSRY